MIEVILVALGVILWASTNGFIIYVIYSALTYDKPKDTTP